MSSKQIIRVHRKVGFCVGGEVRYLQPGDHTDLPEEITGSPYFAAVMKDGLAETLGAGAAPVGTADTAALDAAKAQAEAAKGEVAAALEAQAKAQAEASANKAALEKAQAELKKAQDEIKALKKNANKA